MVILAQLLLFEIAAVTRVRTSSASTQITDHRSVPECSLVLRAAYGYKTKTPDFNKSEAWEEN